ncbi:MAG: hypothetical protein ABNG98_03465 [Flavobacterium sp.]|jgi:hypothetical protein
MKTIEKKVLGLFLLLLFTSNFFAQEKKATYVTVTKMHFKMDNENSSYKEWNTLQKEYFDKVTVKNELILGHDHLVHYFTEDNSEVLNVNIYESWATIEASQKRNTELIEKAWPDKAKRDAFFKKLDSYYQDKHSDEIYVTMPFMKNTVIDSEKQMIYYLRKSHFNFSIEGSDDEFDKLFKEYFDNVTMKNENIKAYHTAAHAWGSDKTDFIEVFVVDNLDAIEKMFKRDEELFNAHWKDDKSRKEFNKKLDKYFTPLHSDYLYRSVVGLQK